MKVFYDFEFIEIRHAERNDDTFSGQVHALYPISVGLISECGSQYYGINENAPWERIFADDWLMENVVRHLPVLNNDNSDSYVNRHLRRMESARALLSIDRYHHDVKPYGELATDVRKFLAGIRDVELWADYCAYDHVLLANMFGAMWELPEWMPMWTHDLQHEMQHYAGIPDCWPMQEQKTEHHALEDARHSLAVYQWMHENDR